MKGIFFFFLFNSSFYSGREETVTCAHVLLYRLKLSCGLSVGLDLEGRGFQAWSLLTLSCIFQLSRYQWQYLGLPFACTCLIFQLVQNTGGKGWHWLGLFGLQHLQQGAIEGLKHCIEFCSIAQVLLPVINLLLVKRWCCRERDFRLQIPNVCNWALGSEFEEDTSLEKLSFQLNKQANRPLLVAKCFAHPHSHCGKGV